MLAPTERAQGAARRRAPETQVLISSSLPARGRPRSLGTRVSRKQSRPPSVQGLEHTTAADEACRLQTFNNTVSRAALGERHSAHLARDRVNAMSVHPAAQATLKHFSNRVRGFFGRWKPPKSPGGTVPRAPALSPLGRRVAWAAPNQRKGSPLRKGFDRSDPLQGPPCLRDRAVSSARWDASSFRAAVGAAERRDCLNSNLSANRRGGGWRMPPGEAGGSDARRACCSLQPPPGNGTAVSSPLCPSRPPLTRSIAAARCHAPFWGRSGRRKSAGRQEGHKQRGPNRASWLPLRRLGAAAAMPRQALTGWF